MFRDKHVRLEERVLHQYNISLSMSSFFIVAFCAVEVFYFLSVLGLYVNLIQIGSKPFFCATLL